MISQIYLPNNHTFFTTYINEPPFSFEFKLGAVETYKVLQDNTNSFISLGGDPDTPLLYKYQGDGWTEFNFKIFGLNPYINDRYSDAAVYEIWVNGIKTYYHFHERRYGILFDTTICVQCKKDQTTDFKFRLTLVEPYADPPTKKEYTYQGGESAIYSRITAKFIPETTSPQSPIIVLGTTQEIVPGVTHIIKSTSQCLLSLPATYPLGVSTKIISYNDNGYKILQKDGQVIKAVGRTTTIGTGGSMTFNDKYTQVNIDCVDANKTFVLNNITGGFLTV